MESRAGPDMTEVRVLCVPLKINDGVGGNRILLSRFFVGKQCFLSFFTQSHAESFRNFVKKSVLKPKLANFDQRSSFAQVQSYS